VCKFCVEKMDFIDYKRADILSQFVQERGGHPSTARRGSRCGCRSCCAGHTGSGRAGRGRTTGCGR
jgi:hypothetical protein